MGAQMAKELGLFNEEERVCTPKTQGRYRTITSDPRSITAGITRTPIQVECTPTGVKSTLQVKSISKHDENISEKVEKRKQDECDSSYKEEDDTSSIKEEDSNSKPPEIQKYLETNIDKLELPELNMESPSKNLDLSLPDIHHSTLILQDKTEDPQINVHPSGNSREITPIMWGTQTPVLVECTPALFALQSRIQSMTFSDLDVQPDDPSAILSDDDQASFCNKSTVSEWLVGVENKQTPDNNSFADSPRQVARKQKELNDLKRQLFFSPDLKSNEITKPKARTPLGNLQAGQIESSPQRALKAKQWRNVAEERRRRGLQDTENTPPNLTLPPLTSVASAPGKITERKRSKINWDNENALLI